MWKWVFYFIFAFILGVLFARFDWPFWLVIIVLFVMTMSLLGEVLHTIYLSTNMKKVEKFIKSKKREPIYRFIYTQGFGTKEEQLSAIEAILQKYKQPYIQHYYRSLQFLLQDDLETALQEAANIKKEPLKSYSEALIHAMIGNETRARSYTFSKTWMGEAILAYIANRKEEERSFVQHANLAIAAARGIQRLSLIYAFRNASKKAVSR